MPPAPELPEICVAVGVGDTRQAEATALAALDRGETFLELRLDLLAIPQDGPGIIRRIRDGHPEARILATCRREGSGGRYRGSIEGQLALLRAAVSAGAALADIEIETIEDAPNALESFRGTAATVASYHNFERTPALGTVVRRLRRTGADIFKVATAVRRPSDNLKLLALCRDHPNMIVAGMGETGAATRLVSPARGGLFSYVAPDPFMPRDDVEGAAVRALPTAPGQVLASSARELYRIHRHSAQSEVYAVIAKPVGHSKSPQIHNRAFIKTGYDAIYIPLLVEAGDIGDFFVLLRQLPLSGVSVTIPHKQSVIPHLDAVEESARGIGAVNTIYWRDGRLVGTNTDASGITVPLAKRAAIRNSRALVVGNGGAAKAAVVALKLEGADVTVTGRNPRRVQGLARLHGVSAIDFEDAGNRRFDILIQATSVGMAPNDNHTLFPGRIPAEVVFDLVYNPLETTLLRDARAQSKVVISGIEMFIEQAAAQFEIWTGLDAPRQVMREAVLGRKVKHAGQSP